MKIYIISLTTEKIVPKHCNILNFYEEGRDEMFPLIKWLQQFVLSMNNLGYSSTVVLWTEH